MLNFVDLKFENQVSQTMQFVGITHFLILPDFKCLDTSEVQINIKYWE